MYNHIVDGFMKIRDDYNKLKSPGSYYAYRGQPLAVFYPNMDKVIPSLYFITIVSLLDELLDLYIQNNFPGAKKQGLDKRITFLQDEGKLVDGQRLHHVRKNRNMYAHEFGKYATWEETDNLFVIIEKELKHLGILS